MKRYNGAMFHGCLKTDLNAHADVSSLDLGMIPEEVIKDKIYPLLENLNNVLNEYKVYIWVTTGYTEDKSTDNEV